MLPLSQLIFMQSNGDAVRQMLDNSGWVAKIVLVILLLFSVLSWTIILTKAGRFRRARAQTKRFLQFFRRSQGFAPVHAAAEQYRPSPLVDIWETGYQELVRQATGNQNLESVERALRAASMEQITNLETRLGWLATTAAATPFIGLFGTVWGIIDAFHGLGTAGAATLAAVAPGISEALITTAAGLFTAVPALIAYNIFVNHLKEFASRGDEFIMEFLIRAENTPVSTFETTTAAARRGARE